MGLRWINACWLIAVVTLASGMGTLEAASPRPNVVVILADDLGFSDIGCYGGEVATPHLDRLAAGGVRYTQAYNTARCWPSRAALLTGFYAQAVGRDSLPAINGEPLRGGGRSQRPAWSPLLAEMLQAAGYRCYHSGKWHIDGDPRKQGFEHSFDALGRGQSNFFDPSGVREDGEPIDADDDFYVTDAIGDHAVRCLTDHAAKHADTPFFHYIAFTSPHFPLHAPQDVIDRYREVYRDGWEAAREARAAWLREHGFLSSPLSAVERDLGPPYAFDDVLPTIGPEEVNRPVPWNSLTAEQQAFQSMKMAIHAAMVDVMDQQIGLVLEQLREMQVLDNTLVIFASDNGASAEMMIRGEGHDPEAAPGSRKTFLCLGPGWSTTANTPYRRHKTWTHEGGIATPLIVHWPEGIEASGELRDAMVHLVDVTPTVLEVTGVEPPAKRGGVALPAMQGKSFAGTWAAAEAKVHDELWWCHDGHRAVRVGDHKLVAAKDEPWELYDLSVDRCETTNLAPKMPERVAELEAAWMRTADTCRLLATDPDPAAALQQTAAQDEAAPAFGKAPNIIYVMTDDQGYGDIAAHGNPILRTPVLDQLREESVRLAEFHVSPTCSPTRAALMTGRHEFRSGVTHTIHERERLALSAVTLPEVLGSAGYRTGIFGKWHLGDEDDHQPGARGFDRVFIHGAGGIGQGYPGSCGDAPGNRYLNPTIRSDGTFVRTRGYCTDVFFGEAIRWMDEARKRDEPFFCYLTPNAPHAPYDAPFGTRDPVLERLDAAGIGGQGRRSAKDIASFLAMVENIDANMGRLLEKLDQWGIADDTLVVFTTDNGTAAGSGVFNDGMRGAKGSPYRGGTRVPAYWRWKGTLAAGVDVPAVTAHIDVLPTLCELAGAHLPQEVASRVEGRSLVPLLRDPQAAWPDRPLFTHVGRWERGQATQAKFTNCRVREGRWSLVNPRQGDAWELYDIDTDPGESTNVADDHPEVVARLAAAYDTWWASLQGDLVNEDLDGPDENPFKKAYWEQFPPHPTEADVAYGPHPKQRLHFWKTPAATAEHPAPLLVFIHGGGWQAGDRLSGLGSLLPEMLTAGISVASVEYRFINEAIEAGVNPPVQAPLHDAARAVQTLRSKAAEWHIDPTRLAASGGSAGACTSLWLAFHDDMADPKSDDPVARQSTRLLAAAVNGAQTTLDPAQMKAWTPNSRYGGHAFGFMQSVAERDSQFAQFLAARDRLLPEIEKYSPYALVSPDDPPVYLTYNNAPALGQDAKDPTHSANFGIKLQEHLEDAGVGCELVYPGADGVQHATISDYLMDALVPSVSADEDGRG